MNPTKRILVMLAALSGLVALDGCSARANREQMKAWTEELNQGLRALGSNNAEIQKVDAFDPGDDRDAFMGSLRRLVAALDAYDINLARVQATLARGLAGSFLDGAARESYNRYVPMLANQGRLSKTRREFATALLEANPDAEPTPLFIHKMERLQADMSTIQDELVKSAKYAGVSLPPQ